MVRAAFPVANRIGDGRHRAGVIWLWREGVAAVAPEGKYTYSRDGNAVTGIVGSGIAGHREGGHGKRVTIRIFVIGQDIACYGGTVLVPAGAVIERDRGMGFVATAASQGTDRRRSAQGT